MTLRRISYISTAALSDERGEIAAILDVARSRNTAGGVTGFLLYTQGAFHQTLEGPPDAVGEIFESILSDDRHGNVVTLFDEAVETRAYTDWSMGHRDVPAETPLSSSIRSIAGAGDPAAVNSRELDILITTFLAA